MVSPIDWSEVLETGVVELDDEHRRLIGQCNALTALLDGREPWAAVVAEARRLLAVCSQHFRSEEELLERTQFPRRVPHAQQHREIERRLGDLVQLLEGADGTREEDQKAARGMRDILIDILFRHDLDYKSHLQQMAGR